MPLSRRAISCAQLGSDSVEPRVEPFGGYREHLVLHLFERVIQILGGFWSQLVVKPKAKRCV